MLGKVLAYIALAAATGLIAVIVFAPMTSYDADGIPFKTDWNIGSHDKRINALEQRLELQGYRLEHLENAARDPRCDGPARYEAMSEGKTC